jgi:hypothetical protein
MRLHLLGSILVVVGVLSACGGGGGGGGGSTSSSPNLTISGVAATGAAIAQGTIDVKCATGTGTATSNTDGSYSVSVASGVQPCMLKATDPITKVELHSIVEAGATTANITPVTNLVVANTIGDDPSTAFTSFSSTTQSKITSSNISTAVSRVQAITAALGTDADMTGVDFMKGTMTAATGNTSGDATDKKIDALMAALAAADKKITDLTTQVKNLTDTTTAAATVTSVVGNAQYALSNCPYARSGDIWVMDLIGSAPGAWNLDFQNMRLKKLSDNSTYALTLKRDSSNALVPCAFTASVSGQTIEYRISTGGVGVWINSNDFGITVPAQKTAALTNASFAGTYPAMGFIKGKTNSLRLGIPFRFEIKSDGSVDGYSCDLTKSIPDCNTAATASSDPVTCTAVSNGTLSCTSLGGMSATAVLYVSGNQASMFMAVTNMTVGSAAYGGLIAMTKAAEGSLPAVGRTIDAGLIWTAGIQSGGTSLVTSTNYASKVESVDATANSFLTSYTGSTLTSTTYINVPAKGFGYGLSNGGKSISMGTNSWGFIMSKGATASYYDGWFAGVKTK